MMIYYRLRTVENHEDCGVEAFESCEVGRSCLLISFRFRVVHSIRK
jgi:hypothetical protein